MHVAWLLNAGTNRLAIRVPPYTNHILLLILLFSPHPCWHLWNVRQLPTILSSVHNCTLYGMPTMPQQCSFTIEAPSICWEAGDMSYLGAIGFLQSNKEAIKIVKGVKHRYVATWFLSTSGFSHIFCLSLVNNSHVHSTSAACRVIPTQ